MEDWTCSWLIPYSVMTGCQQSTAQGRARHCLTRVGNTAGGEDTLQIPGGGLAKSTAISRGRLLLAHFGFLPSSMKAETLLIQTLILNPVLSIHAYSHARGQGIPVVSSQLQSGIQQNQQDPQEQGKTIFYNINTHSLRPSVITVPLEL